MRWIKIGANMQPSSQLSQLRQLPKKIRPRERLPVWGLRIVLGIVLFTLSELVMWQNPPARSLTDWPILLILYICLAAILMDLVVRFQVNTPGALVLVCAIYGLLIAVIINHSAFDSIDQSLNRFLIRGLGLQSAAGLYGLLMFIVVMRGQQITILHILAAIVVGMLWGIWVHWYPIQVGVEWGLVPIETASTYILAALVVIGLMFAYVVPRFQFIRELDIELRWWEAIVVGIPLFFALLIGMIQNIILVIPLIAFIGLGAFMVWTLYYQREGTDPSYLAEMIFAAPNMISYIVLAIAFFMAGTFAYTLIDGIDSIVGNITYWITFAFGAFGLPAAVLLIFWRVFQRETKSVKQEVMEDMIKDITKDIMQGKDSQK
jgi:hypothetical protein